MENALYTWFLQQRSRYMPFSRKIYNIKAIEFYKIITERNDFQARDGWLDKFKIQFGVHLLHRIWRETVCNLTKKIEEPSLVSDQMYNTDKSSLLRKMIPNKIFASS